MNLLFTICGRAGSKGFRNKNLKILYGVPLVNYTLSAIRCYSDDHPEDKISVALNTDSKELQEQVLSQNIYQNIVLCERKPELADDITAKSVVIQDTYNQCKKDKEFSAIIDLDITSPFRRVEDIDTVIKQLSTDEQIDIAFSVVESRRSPYFNMVERKENGYFQIICTSGFTARQQCPETYELNASIYAYRPRMLDNIIDKPILDYCCAIVEMPDYRVLDIDSEDDFEMMEYLLPYYIERDEALKRIYSIASS